MNIASLIEQPFGSITEIVRLHARSRPQHPAIILGDRTLNYAGFDALIDRVAAALQRDGLGPGDVVAICSATSIEYVAAYLGSLRAGVAVAPLAPWSSLESLRAMAANADAQRLFVDAAVASVWRADAEGAKAVPRIALDNSSAGTPWTQWLGDARPKAVTPRPDWLFNLIYSSGTTGSPKGVRQSFGMRWSHIQGGLRMGYGPNSVTLIATPMYSNTTLIMLFPALALGGTLVLMEKFDAGEFLGLAQRHRATHTTMVPTQYQRLLDHPDFDRHDLSSLQSKFVTGEPFRAERKLEVLRRWPGALIERYGMTEGGGSCNLKVHEHLDKLHTVGRPVAGHDIRLIDDQGRELPPDMPGEIVGHSPAMMEGYHGQPEKSKQIEWFDASGKRFIRTGDVGRFDPDGFLILLERKKDMIISGGVNIYPSDIEAELRKHPAVADVAVVGVPSKRWGETPIAFVVVREGSVLTADALLAWANPRLGKTQRLAAVEFTDALPRNGIGKVLKRQLRDGYRGSL